MYLIEQELRNQFAAVTQTVDALFAHKVLQNCFIRQIHINR